MHTNRNLISDIWSYVKAYKAKFWLATGYRIFSDLIWLYPPYAFAVIINFFSNYDSRASLSPIYTAFFLTTAVVIFRSTGLYYSRSIMFKISKKVDLDAQFRSIKHLMLLDISWHEKENAGNKFKRIERGGASLDKIIKIWINGLIPIIINLVGVSLIILKSNFGIGISVSIFLISYYFLARFYRKRAVISSTVVNVKEETRSGLLFETINNIRSVKVMSMAGKILETLSTNASDLFEAIKTRIYWFQAGNTIRNLYGHLFRVGAMIFIVYGVMEGRYEIGFLVLFIGYFDRAWESMGQFADATEELAIAKNAVSRMQEILNTPITIDDEAGKVKFPKDWKKIEVKNISFSYQNKTVLDDISFEVNRGEKVGIVGLSGAGKSTLFKLLLKEHESYSGEICFDDVSLKTISKRDYFDHLAVVLQETELFNASLRNNIVITNQAEEKNEELLEKAIEIAHVKDFMAKLPEGIQSIVGEKGIKLSGGEKQRVGIARAIFKNPQILLLDEATSHLDIESEKKIKNSLHKFFKGVTAIVIAHRLTTIKEMDRIIIIENGKIIESGDFATLYESKGRFFDLWEQQKL